MTKLNLILVFSLFISSCSGQPAKQNLLAGAERTEYYLPLLKDNQTGIVANHSSLVGDEHLVDFLLTKEIEVIRIFSPEHGFRGDEDAGKKIESGLDEKTGLKIVSLYGAHKKPMPEDLENIDIMIFDLQDVGVRFYTYISTLHYVMEACAENNIPLIVLDRPNPNANYIDGPVLRPGFESFVGMHEVPVVYGMTIGEYALMINGEGWLKDGLSCSLKVVDCKGYKRSIHYSSPVPPSPNLPNYLSIRLYPSLCFFEGTALSVGRGTDFPFQVFGHPDLKAGDFYFTPESRPGAATNPKMKGQSCRGFDLRNFSNPENIQQINLEWLIKAYQNFPDKEEFFTEYFSLLSGSNELKNQIEEGLTAAEIRKTWTQDLSNFLKIRQKYLLYDD